MARRLMSLAERISYLHDTEKFFDLEFVLRNNGQTEKVKGHKAIFASSSDAFEAMLYGPMAMGDIIEMNDVEPHAFKTLKKFVYTDDVAFKSVVHAQNVFKVADMYDLMQLSRLAEAYISANLSSATALRILEFSRSYQKLEMQEQCLEMIRRQTAAVLSSDDFFSCDLNFVDMIVSEKELNIKEIDLFNSVEKWAESNINMEDDPSANDVQLFSDVINKIRFLSMTAEEFAKGPSKSPLLTEQERLHLLTSIAAPGSTQLPDRFSKESAPRNGNMMAVSTSSSGKFAAASNTDLNFTSSQNGNKTSIKFTKRGMSTLQLNVKYYLSTFMINDIPFTIYLKAHINECNRKCLAFGLRCHDVNFFNCTVYFTQRFVCKERKPLLGTEDSWTFNETKREVEEMGLYWSYLVAGDYITSSDDSVTMEFDCTLYKRNQN